MSLWTPSMVAGSGGRPFSISSVILCMTMNRIAFFSVVRARPHASLLERRRAGPGRIDTRDNVFPAPRRFLTTVVFPVGCRRAPSAARHEVEARAAYAETAGIDVESSLARSGERPLGVVHFDRDRAQAFAAGPSGHEAKLTDVEQIVQEPSVEGVTRTPSAADHRAAITGGSSASSSAPTIPATTSVRT